MTPHTARTHLLVMALMGGVVVFINTSSGDDPLRAQDRDLLTLLRTDHPNLLRGLDLRAPDWARLPVANLVALDLSGRDLRALRLSRRALKGVSLKGSHMEQAEFTCVAMNGVDLSGANLSQSRFDYTSCDKPMELQLNLNGANLSQAVIKGGSNERGKCATKLTIKGNLNGASFEGATMQCVALQNTTAVTAPSPSSPQYAGINFGGSDLNHLALQSGNFVFSDFYQAQVRHLTLYPKTAHLRYSNLAQLRCQNQAMGCELSLKDGSAAAPNQAAADQRLSLNVRGSQIISNLRPPASPSNWPALLCDPASGWRLAGSPATKAKPPAGSGFWILDHQGKGTLTCSQPPQEKAE